jgi:hypothetical protein
LINNLIILLKIKFMKKIYFSLILVFIFKLNSQAQCTPGSNFADSTFGAWPDTTTNFPNATSGVFYSTDLNFKVPSDAGDVDPLYAGLPIIDFTVDSVGGLNSGFSYACNLSNNTYLGGANGCAQISGTSTELDTSNITIYIKARLQTFLGPIVVPYSFAGYHIKVLEQSLQLIEKSKNSLHTISPNPVENELIISNLDQVKSLDIYTLSGQKIKIFDNILNQKLDVGFLTKGMYILEIKSNSGSELHKIIKN